jgi:hypothetical protein
MSSAPMLAATTPALQTSVTKQFAGLTLHGNYTYSHCLDEISNGGLLPFSSLGIISPLPGDLRREYGNCDYDIRHNISAFGIYEVPFHSTHAILDRTLGGWQLSQTAILHSGVPFSVLSAPYTANSKGLFQGSGPQYANRIPGVALYRKTPVSGVTQPGTMQWLNLMPSLPSSIQVLEPVLDGRQPFRYAPEQPTTGKGRISLHSRAIVEAICF